MKIFEAIMLLCFGIGWPVSIWKTIRTKQVAGKSPLFLGIIWAGYASGIINKLINTPDWVLPIYCFNLCLVTVDFCLYWFYRRRGLQSSR